MSNSTSPHEIWKPVPGYEDLYRVSNWGRIWSRPRARTKGGILSPNRDGEGYCRIFLWRDGSSRSVRLARLVCELFNGPAPEGTEVRHLDGDATNDRADNLRWGTSAENNRDQVRHGTHKNTRKTHCPRGHLLDPPNLMKAHWERRGRRSCLACDRARAEIARAGGDLRAVSDAHYRRIMGPDLGIRVDLPDD